MVAMLHTQKTIMTSLPPPLLQEAFLDFPPLRVFLTPELKRGAAGQTVTHTMLMEKWKGNRRHHSSRVMVNFFLKLLSLTGFIMGPTTMVFNLVRLVPFFIIRCFVLLPGSS